MNAAPNAKQNTPPLNRHSPATWQDVTLARFQAEANERRLVRIETRLVRLMAHMGLDSEGVPA